MARPLRIEFSGALYHVMSRGNARRPIVRDDGDRARRLAWLERTVMLYRWRLHAFCLMDNHEHLYVETPEPNLSAGMQHLNGSYTSYFNRRHRRVGHLFQGRFKAVLIENAGHYSEISRYIHLNPVRAGRVARPEAWRWSSYPGYRNRARALAWVTYADVLREFGRRANAARQAYRRYVMEGVASMPPCPWADAVSGLVVGDEAFVERVRALLAGRPPDPALPVLADLRPRPALARIVALTAEAFDADPAGWTAGRRDDGQARAVAAYLARRCFGHRARDVASALGYRSHGGVASALQRIEAASPALRRTVAQLEKRIAND
ncbi:MAG: transposase [Phycisphaerae bacterium]|nr:transposase [Phycisphaerae bacterium]